MKRIAVLTGAGMSADSGLSTFRDSGGLWEEFDILEIASPEGWRNNPETVLDFYNKRRREAAAAEPNEGHRAIAELERKYRVDVITQNVDDLHERAGSTRVLHLHGELRKVRSVKDPDLVYDIGDSPIRLGDKADDGGQLRPHVVWFGEMVPMIDPAAERIEQADLLIVIGSSLSVYPAAGLIHAADRSIPKYLIDPADPEMVLPEEWQHIPERSADGTPKLVEQFLHE